MAQFVSRAVFNAHGNVVISGSKDGTVKMWDLTRYARYLNILLLNIIVIDFNIHSFIIIIQNYSRTMEPRI